MVGLLALTLGVPAARGAVVLEKKLTSISVSGKDSVAAGGKLTLTATAKYDDGSSSKVTPTKCTSSNTGIATVSSSGVVTGIKIGSASITVSYTEAGVTKTAKKTVKVTKGLKSVSITGADSVAYKKTTTYVAHATFTDGSSSKVSASWGSATPAVATVNTNGVVTGKKGGTSVIAASYTYGGVTKTAKKSIKVTKKLTALSVSGSSTVDAGSKIALTATAKFDDGTSAKVTPTKCATSSSSIATVTNAGVVTGKKAGKVNITVSYTYNGTSKTTASVKKAITVKKKLKSIALTGGGTSVVVGKTLKFGAKATYTDGTTAVVTPKWSTSDKAIATISTAGVLTGKKGGTVNVTASYTYDGVTKTVTKSVTVKKELKSLAITGSGWVFPGATTTLGTKATYTDGTTAVVSKNSTWTSSNKAVATVSKGVVYGVKVGTVTITADYTYGGVKKTVKKTVKVEK